MLSIENLHKRYGDVVAVDGISFEAKDGAITTLLGANGSGKTTTFNAVAGLLKPDSGRVTIDDIDIGREPLKGQARLGFFPDKFGLYPRLTTREHLMFYGGLCGVKGIALEEAVERIVAQLQMQDIIDRRTKGFSQGQRMKVALARAMVHSPRNLVLDEPSRGLDVMSVRLLREILLSLKKAGHAVLLSSHVMAEVGLLSDHIVMIARGRVCAEGTVDSLVQQSGRENLEEAFVHYTREVEAA